MIGMVSARAAAGISTRPGTFEAVDADRVHTDLLGFEGVPDAGALVHHLDPGFAVGGQEGLGVAAGGLDDLDPAVHDRPRVLLVRRRVDRGQDGQVHAERLVGEFARALDLAPEVVGRGLGQCGDETEPTGIGDGRDEFGPADPHHPALHDRVFDTEGLGEPGPQHRCSPLLSRIVRVCCMVPRVSAPDQPWK
jgi:hypothetical protein